MLILVGVVLNLTLGEHGIFKTAQMAAKNYTEVEKKEQEELTKLYKELGIENLPENTIPIPKGFYYVGGTKNSGVVM